MNGQDKTPRIMVNIGQENKAKITYADKKPNPNNHDYKFYRELEKYRRNHYMAHFAKMVDREIPYADIEARTMTYGATCAEGFPAWIRLFDDGYDLNEPLKPNPYELVLISYFGKVSVGYCEEDGTYQNWHDAINGDEYIGIIDCWMPLPEAPRKEGCND